MKSAQGKITEVWEADNQYEGLSASVTVYMEPDGRVARTEIKESSGNMLFDKSIVKAVEKASPLSMIKGLSSKNIQEFRTVVLHFKK